MTRRRSVLAAMLAGTTLALAPLWLQPDIRIIWNTSASVPVGLYRIVPASPIQVTDLAVVRPPADLADFLHARRYLPRGLPLIKSVLALKGTEVCRSGLQIIAYGAVYGRARASDSHGRPLPDWQGCRVLGAGEAFFMNWDAPDSFDSRYTGPLPLSSVIGRVVPVWTRDDPDPVAEDVRRPVTDEP